MEPYSLSREVRLLPDADYLQDGCSVPLVSPKLIERLERRDRLYDFLGGHDGTGIVRNIHVKSRVHLLIGVIRGGIPNHRHLVAKLSGEAYRCLHASVRYEPDDDELMDAMIL